MARLEYLDPTDLPADECDALETLSDDAAKRGTEDGDERGVDVDERDDQDRVGVRNVYRILAHESAVLEGFRTYVATLWREAGLSPVERETTILAVARSVRSRYVWHQHVRLAGTVGMMPEQLDAIANHPNGSLPPALRAIVDYATRLVEGAVDDDVHERLAQHYSNAAVVSVGMLAGTYLGLARFLDAVDVDVEEPFVGWE